MAKLAVIGSCSVDLVVEAARRPQAGETLFAEHFFMSCGGKGANQAVAAARLGADVAMIGAIGEDAYGKMLCENFVKNGVDARFLMTLPDVSTGTAHITLAEGDNSILVVPAANFRLTAAHIEQALDQLGELDMVLLQNEVPQDVTEDAIRLCAERNIPVLWNPAPARELAPDIMAMCRYITPNDHELALLFDVADPLELSAEWQKKLIVTRGKTASITMTARTFTASPGNRSPSSIRPEQEIRLTARLRSRSVKDRILKRRFGSPTTRPPVRLPRTARRARCRGVTRWRHDMQKHGILNSKIAKVLADLGHTDRIMIADCGLPIPRDVERIDLALEFGVPSFLDVLRVVMDNMKVEQYLIASEMDSLNRPLFQEMQQLMGDIPGAYVTHGRLKEYSRDVKAIIRTGEATPYANVILQSGCIF